MNAQEQQEIALKMKAAFEKGGIIVEEPYTESGQLKFREPNYAAMAFRLAQIGYRFTLGSAP